MTVRPSPEPFSAIWILGDQHRGQALSCNGDPNVSTPHIDRLAAEGLNVRGAVSGFPLCCPFRGSMLTGRYPHHCVPGHEHPMPAGLPTVAHAFAAHGYETAYFGKWHLDGFRERNGRAAWHTVPRERRGGFDTWLGYENNNSQWDCWLHGHDRQGREVPHYRLDGYETDALGDLLVDFVEEKGREKREGRMRPFFAVLSVQPPHDPYLAPADAMARHQPQRLALRPNVPPVDSVVERARRELAGYYAQVENLDGAVGRVREALRAAGLDIETHVLFFSDHGDMLGSHGQFRKMGPWEEAIRIPFVMGGVQPMYGWRGGSSAALINHVDIAPTTLGLCGIAKPDAMSGSDLSGLRKAGGGPPPRPDSAYLQSVIPTGHGDSVDRPWRGVVTEDGWKYVALAGTPWQMFNLNEDPYEFVNLAFNSRYRAERKRLNERVRQWVADTGDTFDLPEV